MHWKKIYIFFFTTLSKKKYKININIRLNKIPFELKIKLSKNIAAIIRIISIYFFLNKNLKKKKIKKIETNFLQKLQKHKSSRLYAAHLL